MSMLIPAAMRADHVRTATTLSGTRRRACPCCATYTGKAAPRARRTQRRRETIAWRKDQDAPTR